MVDKHVVFVMGPTGAGKSTLLQACQAYYGEKLYLIEVGKLLRAKYPPEYFQGQAAPKKTAKEALELMFEGIKKGKDAAIILIDGQPRDIDQTYVAITDELDGRRRHFLHLFALTETRRTRLLDPLVGRDAKDSGKAALSEARLVGDLPKLYEVLSLLHADGQHVVTVNTDEPGYDPVATMKEIVGAL